MNALAHQILSGLAMGGIYAAVALAIVMIYQATRHVNFAQGEMAMLSTYLAATLIDAGVPYWIAFLATLAISFLVGAAIERLLIRRFADSPPLALVIVFIGLLITINSLAGWLFTYSVRSFESPFPETAPFAAGFVSPHEIGSVAVTLVMLALIYVFFRFTPLGLAMRAAAENPISARLVGIKVDAMLAIGWGLAAAVGAVAGMMAAPIVYLDPNMMGGVLLYGFAAALLGGIDNPVGAAVGGFIVGVLENLAGAYVVGSEVKLSVALAIIVGVLVVRPAGLFGRAVVTRV